MQFVELTTKGRLCIPENNFLGYEEENDANKLVFRFTDGFIDGFAEIVLIRNGEKGTIELEKVDETYEFPVKRSILTQEGNLKFQLVITKSNGFCIKYNPFTMIVLEALDSDIPMPEEYPSWIELANSKLAELEEAIENSEKVMEEIVTAKENGEFNGKDGKDGFSPSAKVTQTEEGAEIEITDKDGTTKATVYNGTGGGGGTGQDGFSPIATVTQTDTGAEIEITDKEGTTKATVTNGKDGISPEITTSETVNGTLITIKDKHGTNWVHVENGEKGEDGFSPTVGVYETPDGAMISITDINGMTAVPIRNGKDLTNPKIQDLVLPILETNSIYRRIIDESITFLLPTVTDNTILNTIQLQVVISNYENISIDLGTTKYFGDIPELGNGSFILYYEYDGANWCVGALPVVSEV